MLAEERDRLFKYQTQTIVEEFIQCKTNVPVVKRHKVNDPDIQISVHILSKVADKMNKLVGEELDNEAEKWVKSATYEKFLQIAKCMFADGIISWSRIVVLFMFAVKVVVKALDNNLNALVVRVIQFVVDFIFRQSINKWIQSRGGWIAIVEDYSSSRGGRWMFIGFTLIVLFMVFRST